MPITFLLLCSCILLLKASAQITLGTAASYGVLGASTVTNTGDTTINGNLGVSPGTSSTGFPPGIVIGEQHFADGPANQAQLDANNAFNAINAQARTATLTGQDLGGQTLVAGTYFFATSAQLTGQLTLDGGNNPNSQFLFQIGTTLNTATAASIVLINGAQACNVFYAVGSSATLGTGTTFIGNVIAQQAVTANTGATVSGGLYALVAAVTLDDNDITRQICLPPQSTSTSQPPATQPDTTVPPTTTITPTVTTAPETQPGTTISPTVTSTTNPSVSPVPETQPDNGVPPTATPTLSPVLTPELPTPLPGAEQPAPEIIPGVIIPDTGFQGAGIPGVNIPGVDIPGTGIPGVDIPGVDIPGLDDPGVDIPGVDIPGVDIPGVDIPGVDIPGVDIPGVDIPGVDIPGVDIPGVDIPGVDIPGVDIPGVETSFVTTITRQSTNNVLTMTTSSPRPLSIMSSIVSEQAEAEKTVSVVQYITTFVYDCPTAPTTITSYSQTFTITKTGVTTITCPVTPAATTPVQTQVVKPSSLVYDCSQCAGAAPALLYTTSIIQYVTVTLDSAYTCAEQSLPVTVSVCPLSVSQTASTVSSILSTPSPDIVQFLGKSSISRSSNLGLMLTLALAAIIFSMC